MDIITAAEEGDLAFLKSAIRSYPDSVNEKTSLGDTLLHCAVYQRQTDVVKLLISKGADLNARGDRGRTPLHAAAVAGSAEIARILIRKGAKLETTDITKKTPLRLAVIHVELGRPETQQVVDVLLKSGAEYDLESAVVQGDDRRVRELLAVDPDVLRDLSKEDCAVLVHSAIYSPAVMKLLLDYGGDPNARTRKGAFAYPPITRVISPEIAKLLLDHGADINAVDSAGKTRLQTAKKNNEAKLEQLLIQFRGAQHTSKTKKKNG